MKYTRFIQHPPFWLMPFAQLASRPLLGHSVHNLPLMFGRLSGWPFAPALDWPDGHAGFCSFSATPTPYFPLFLIAHLLSPVTFSLLVFLLLLFFFHFFLLLSFFFFFFLFFFFFFFF